MLTKPKSRETVNLSVDTEVLAEAKALGVDVSHAAEAGLTEAVRKEKERRWKEENREAIESSNRWVEENGLPLVQYRQF